MARVLLIDDNPGFLLALQVSVLQLPQMQLVGTIASAEAALQWKPADVDIIVLDVHLDGMSGIEAVQFVRALFPDAHLIVHSAAAEPELLRSLTPWADVVLAKGYLEPLLDALQRAGATSAPVAS